MKAWVYQDDKQVKKHGPERASWYAGWIDPEGKRRCQSCGPGARGKDAAERLARRIEGQLLAGTYRGNAKKIWQQFRHEYEEKVLDGMAPETRRLTLNALDHFERIARPKKLATIKTQTIDAFKAKRRAEPGQREGELVSPATVNKELRHLRAVLRKALKWKYLPEMPDFEFVREPRKLPTYVTGEHFAAIYGACDKAQMPEAMPFQAAEWWRALLVFAYMTGWRISELLALRRDDLDLEAGEAVTRAADNKGGRDERVKLHPVVLEHLRRLPHFGPMVFPWNHNRRTLWTEFLRIQQAATVKNAKGEEEPLHLACHEQHEHTAYCHVYGFHDLRRAFATMNADRLTADALQALMRHKSYQTTQRYINMARQLDVAVASLHVPDVLKVGRG
jgi:integrase